MSGARKLWEYLGWQNITIAGLIYISTLMISYFILIKPQFNEYDKILVEQEAIGNTYVKLTQINIEESIDSVNVQLGKLHKYRIDYESRVADETDLKAVIPFIDNLSKNGNLEISSLEIMEKSDRIQPGIEKQYVNMIVKSKYFYPITDFINQLDNYSKWILIESFDIAPSGDLNQLNLVISLLVKSK